MEMDSIVSKPMEVKEPFYPSFLIKSKELRIKVRILTSSEETDEYRGLLFVFLFKRGSAIVFRIVFKITRANLVCSTPRSASFLSRDEIMMMVETSTQVRGIVRGELLI